MLTYPTRLKLRAGMDIHQIYFGEVNHILVVLLCGGDKSTQKQDIKTAIALWEQYSHEIERHLRDV